MTFERMTEKALAAEQIGQCEGCSKAIREGDQFAICADGCMSIRWQQAYPQARIVACSGEIEIGAVFPPLGKMQGRNPWTWRLWVNGKSWATDGASRTKQAAQEALLTAWQGFLAAANLTDQTATPAASNAMGIDA